MFQTQALASGSLIVLDGRELFHTGAGQGGVAIQVARLYGEGSKSTTCEGGANGATNGNGDIFDVTLF
jgi:hypothetical protein